MTTKITQSPMLKTDNQTPTPFTPKIKTPEENTLRGNQSAMDDFSPNKFMQHSATALGRSFKLAPWSSPPAYSLLPHQLTHTLPHRRHRWCLQADIQ